MVPERLAERITDWLPHATKIDIKVAVRGGWRVVNTIFLDGDEEPSEVYTMVKACADHHAADTGEGAKYRALIWRMAQGIEHERRRVTFNVRAPYEEDETETTDDPDRRDQRSAWRDIVEAQQRFVEFMAEYNQRATDRVLEQSKQDSDRLNPLSDVIHELVGPYRDGLRMKADAVREVGELRVRQQLAEAQVNDSGKFWEVFGPAVQVAAVQAQQRFLGNKPKPKALPASRAATPTVERREIKVGAPSPSTPPPAPPASQPRSEPAASAAQAPMPTTLHELAAALLDGMGADTLVSLMRLLDEAQAAHLEAITQADNDDTSAEAIVGLMQSLMANPTTVVGMQRALGAEHIAAFQQIAVLAKRHLDERDAHQSEAAPPALGDAASPEKDEPSS